LTTPPAWKKIIFFLFYKIDFYGVGLSLSVEIIFISLSDNGIGITALAWALAWETSRWSPNNAPLPFG